jgi:hypothetical protein
MAAAIAELAGSQPVRIEWIAARAGVPHAQVLDFLRRSPAEWDEHGRLLGFGRPRALRGGGTLRQPDVPEPDLDQRAGRQAGDEQERLRRAVDELVVARLQAPPGIV